jgi:hypothetical protein
MTIARTLASIQRSKQFKKLLDSGLSFVSTDRQLANGTLAFAGKIKAGKKTIRPAYAVTLNGAVISNEYVARRVEGESLSDVYRQGLTAVAEILGKRLSA